MPTTNKSRFLRGAPVDEAKIERGPSIEPTQLAAEALPLRWLHATRSEFELLDKPIVFDDAQEAVRRRLPTRRRPCKVRRVPTYRGPAC